MSRNALVLPLVFLLCGSSFAADDWTPPTEKKAMDKAVAEITKEYKALSGNQDLVPTRRRRVLLLRLGQLPTKKCVKQLRIYVKKERDTRAKINAMYSLVRVGDVKAVDAMYKYCLKEIRSVYPAYLGRALSKTTDDERVWEFV